MIKEIKTINEMIKNYRIDVYQLINSLKKKDFKRYEYKKGDNSVMMKFNSGKETFIITSYKLRTPDIWTTGTHNYIPNSNHYIFYIDYDKTSEEYVKQELKHLQRIYPLGSIDVFKSSEKGFHGISYVYLTAKEFMEIINNSSADWCFKNIPRFSTFRLWVLRHFPKGATKKPEFIYTLKGDTDRLQSSAHYKFIKLLYPNIQKLQNPDNKFKLYFIDYQTGNNVDIKEEKI